MDFSFNCWCFRSSKFDFPLGRKIDNIKDVIVTLFVIQKSVFSCLTYQGISLSIFCIIFLFFRLILLIGIVIIHLLADKKDYHDNPDNFPKW